MSELDDAVRRVVGDVLHGAWDWVVQWGSIRATSARAKRFRQFGDGSAIGVKAAVDLPIQGQCEPPDDDIWFQRMRDALYYTMGDSDLF